MFIIHAIRNGKNQVLPIKIIEIETEIIETAEDSQAYIEAIEDLEQGNTLDFNDLKSSWCLGKSADV